MGYIVATLINVNRDPKARAVTVDEVLGRKRKPMKQSPEQMLEQVKTIHKMIGGA